jgi:shikimate dehydrogenase
VSQARRLAVLGHPISHSLSPRLHQAAYATLGLDWRYEAVDVVSDDLAGFVASRDAQWRGLSLTMPLKRAVLPLLDTRDDVVELIDVANTVLFEHRAGRRALHGYNTDVAGAVEALRAAGTAVGNVHVLGSGATATSVLLAVSRLGATTATVHTRSPARCGALRDAAGRFGLDLRVEETGSPDEYRSTGAGADLVVSTLPGDAGAGVEMPEGMARTAVLFDVAYDPWPSPLAARWQRVGGRVVTGLELLVRQALAQVRIFVGGDPDSPLPAEPAVFAAMRASIGLAVDAERD